MKYLVDANVLSEPTKPSPDPRVVDWLRTHEPDIAIDAVILGKLCFGILILPQGKKRMALERWFDAGGGRLHCLSWDTDTGLKWAELLARLRKTGKAMPIKDSFIGGDRDGPRSGGRYAKLHRFREGRCGRYRSLHYLNRQPTR